MYPYKDKFLLRQIRAAKKGDVRAIYQLYLNYSVGANTDKDPEQSQYYLDKLKLILGSSNVRVSEVTLKDFRGVRKATLKLDDKITVLVGNNGFGKSTFLDAIAYSLSWLKSNVLREDRNGTNIKESDINNNKEVKHSTVATKFSFAGKNFSIMLSKALEGSSEKRNNELLEIKALAGMYRAVSDKFEDLSLPLVAYYSIARSTEGAGIDARKKVSKNEWSKYDAYDDVLTDRHDFAEFFNWFVFMHNLASQRRSDENEALILALEAEIRGTIEALDNIKDIPGAENLTGTIEEKINSQKAKLKELKIKNSSKESDSAGHIINNIKKAITTFLPDINEVRVHYNKNDVRLLIKKGEVEVDAQQLSQGEKSLLTLIGDLARRLSILNPSKKNSLEGDGVVLIDEIDLHLHPQWQQSIVSNLLNTFPNVQFIISTHSPQVLSTVSNTSIRILKENFNYEDEFDEIFIDGPQYQTKGVQSTSILENVMYTDAIPPIKEADWINQYKILIETNRIESEVATKIKYDIERHFGKDHPLVLECDNLIKLQEIKRKLALRRSGKDI